MKEKNDCFTPMQPASKKARAFIESEPTADWKRSLSFLLENFPQIKEEKIDYIIEGGAAISLLGHHRTNEPKDIDLIVARQDLADDFQNSEKFDAKTLKEWFAQRGLDFTRERGEFLLASSTIVQHEGKKVLVLNPNLLACSKLLEFRGRKPRIQDTEDLAFLGVSKEVVEETMKELGASIP